MQTVLKSSSRNPLYAVIHWFNFIGNHSGWCGPLRLIEQAVKFQFDLVHDKSEILNVRNKVQIIDIYHQ